MKTFKRALSVMLATVMILTTFFIFDPTGMFPSAQAAVTATDPTYGDLYFVVPEAIYLAPKYNSSTASTTSHFQWYVNDTLMIDDFDETVSIGLDKGEAGTGKLAFLYPGATSVKISYKWQTEPGLDMNVSGSEASITYGDGNARNANRNFTLGLTDGYGSTQITWGQSPEIPANTTGIWVCWIATYTDSADGLEKQAYAYTYLYKPYVAPIAVAIEGRNTRSQNHYGSYISWISGVHGVSGSARGGSKYPNTSGRAFLPFSSSGSGETGGSLNFTLNGYMSLPDDNLNPNNWSSGSQTGVADATVYPYKGTTDSHSSGDDFTITYAYSSTGLLTVDKSRYSNLNQIPNLSVGLMVTDDESSTSGGAWFVSNFDNHTDKFDSDHTDYWEYKGDNYHYITEYWDPLYTGDRIASGGNWNDLSASEGEGLKINERWRKDISGKGSGVFYVGSGYANQQNEKFLYIGWRTGTDRIFDTSELRCRVEMFDRTVLRDAYNYAIKSFPVNNLQLLDQASDSWTQFFQLFNAVATWLCKVDCGAYTTTMGFTTPTALANALRNKVDQISTMSNPDRQTYLAYQYNVKVYDDNGTWKLVTRSGASTEEYHTGARIDYTAEEYAGYSLAGHVQDYQEATSTYGNATVKQARNVTPGEYVVAHATGPARCTFYYLRDEYTIAYDLSGGELPNGIINPTSYNIDSDDITLNAPVRPGFSFDGWISESDNIYTPVQTITIPQGSTGNRSYKAIWGAQNYSVVYHGNGATGGNTPPSTHTTDVAQPLNGNTFFRSYNLSFTYNIWDDWDTDYDELNYLFNGWNTEPDGTGEAFVNRQSVINLTTESEFHLYAQWYPQQYVLPTPEKDGFAFDGWYSTPNFVPSSFVGDGGSLFATDHDMDLYAKWAENQYNIIYDGNGATGGSTQKSSHVQGVPQTLTPNGYVRQYTVSFDAQGGTVSPVSATSSYVFASWNTKPDGTGRGFSPDFNVTDIVDVFKDPDTNEPVNTLVLYAQWVPDSSTTIVLPTPTRPGWTFRGWYEGTVDADGDIHLTNQVYGTITPTANTILYATWTAAAFVITFDAKGGQAVPYMAYTTEDTTLLPETTRVGYAFGGWKPRDTEGNWDSGRIYSAGTPVTGRYGHVTLDAQWTPVRYKITFDVNGGDNYPNVFYTIESEDEIGTPTRNGYIFQGWTVTTADADSNWTESVYAADTLLTGKHGNVTLQAQWLKASYLISFFTDGGNEIPDLEYDTSSTATLPTPVKIGYTFGGWKPHESSGSWDINTIYVGGTALGGKYGNVRLDAQWTQTQYMISYDERGGTEIPNTIYNVNSLEVLPSTTRTAYTFNGWKPKTAVGSWDPAEVYPAGTNLNGKYGDVQLTAQWTPIEYRITFDPNGAEYYPTPSSSIMNYTIESEDELGAPDRPGYEFLGWLVLESEGNWLPAGSTYRSTTIVTRKYGNVSLQAMWEEDVYNITYVLTEGASVDPETPNPATYTYDTPTFTLNNPEKPGYTFAGWTGTDIEDGPSLTVEVPTHSEGDRTYTATWDVITYTIRYDLANGYEDPEYDPNPTTYTVETPGITLIPPLKDGYEFDGWTGTGVNGKQKIVTIFAGTTGNLMFTAHWKAKDYTISYNLAGGQLPDGVTNPTTYNINIENDIVLNNPVRSGFTFDGWTGTGLPGKVMNVTILAGSSGDRTYTANWKGVPYDITYDLDGGSMPEGMENPTQYTYDTETFTLKNPVRSGYTFVGWTGSNGGVAELAVAIPQGSTGNKSYTANWSLVTYSISYNLNAGTLTEGVSNPTSYTIESSTITLHNPIRLGHTFAGWTGTGIDDTAMEVEIPTGSTGNREYTATWVAAQYTISYDLAGGAIPNDPQTGEPRVNPTSYGYDTPTFTLWEPAKTGYTFLGWTGSNGEQPQRGLKIDQGSSGNRSYTANWSAIEYQITYDLVGGSATIQNPTTYTIETDTFTLHNPERTGYAFIGWSGTDIAEDEVEGRVIIVQGSTGNRHYVAHWDGDATKFTITYDYQGGQEDPSKPNRTEYTVNTPTFMLNAPIKTGFTFTGWTGANGGTPELQVYINGNGFVPGDKNYYANWTPNTYYVDYLRNGGTGGTDMANLACTYDPEADGTYQLFTLDTCTYTKSGYDFTGWATSSDATQIEYVDGASIKDNLTDKGHFQLYAIWTPTKFHLHFAKGINTANVVNGTVSSIEFPYTEDPDTHEPATVVTLPTGEEDNFYVCYSDANQVKRSFQGWNLNGTFYAPGAAFTCPNHDVSFTAVWSANYYELDRLVEEIEEYRDNDAVPANENDEQYMDGGEYAEMSGSGGYYPWDNYDMTAVETALYNATRESNRNLPQDQQDRVTRLATNLQTAFGAITLNDVDYDEPFPCNWTGEGFFDSQNGIMYPPCEEGEEHSYNSLMAIIEEVLNCDPEECLYTEESVQNLYNAIYGNNYDVVGIVTQVDNAALKVPATDVLSAYVDQMAEAYHTLLDLKDADYTALDELITVYLPGMHDDVEAGSYVTYQNLESYYTQTSANRLRTYYNRIDRTYKNVDQWRIEPGGNVYNTLKSRIDALVPVGADYTDVFYEILSIPYGSDDFEYPAPNVIMANYPTWNSWAQENDGAISEQMDDAYLRACYTEKSVNALYRVLDNIKWDMNIFEQDAVNGSDNITSYYTLLRNSIDALRQRKYTITYMYNDGTNASFTTQGDYEYGAFIGTFPSNNPERQDFVFGGWSEDPDEPIPVSVDDRVFGNMYLYAIWVSNYTILYNLNGGTLPDGVTNPTNYSEYSGDIVLNNPVRPGYDFDGWTGTDLFEPTMTVTIAQGSTGSRSYAATWEPKTYTIGYDLAGGTLAIGQSNPTSYTIESRRITLNNPTLEGYEFAGWTGTDLEEPTVTVAITTGSIGNREYTATWRPVVYTITFLEQDLADPDVTNPLTTENPTTYTIESDDITLLNPEKEGCTFLGWTGSNGADPQELVTIPQGSMGDLTYIANWEAETFSIRYTLAGGSLPQGVTNTRFFTIATPTFTINNPVRDGYEFAGWTGTGLTEPTMNLVIPTGSTGSRSYVATWAAASFPITYELGGGSSDNPTSYTSETPTFALHDPVRAGYEFAGWTGTGLGSTPQQRVLIYEGSSGAMTFTAHWDVVEYQIAYELNSGTATNPATYTIETETFTLSTPTRDGYAFTGWTGSNSDTPQMVVQVVKGSTGDRAYTAHWEILTYTISYDLDGGTLASANPESYKVTSPAFTLNNPQKTGYSFAGWTGTDLTAPTEYVTVPRGTTGDRAYTATWTPVNYSIFYYMGGGTADNPATYTVETETFALNEPTRVGYDFTGWTGTDVPTVQKTVLIAKGSTGEKSFTAHWQVKEYTIGYDLAGGSVEAENPTTYTIESSPITLYNPTKRGYEFAGWTGTGLETATVDVVIPTGSSGNRSYVATWGTKVYTITYDLDGGTAVNPTTYTTETETFTLNAPTKDGYDFLGWTGSNGIDPQKTVTIETGSVGAKNYIANWQTATFTIEYDLDGGTLAGTNPTTYTVESGDITLANPTKDGYTFAGWTGTGLDEATTSVTITTGSTGNRAYTATWTAQPYSITYDLAGGSATNPTTYTVESSDITLANPTKDYYTFAGWTGTGLTEPTMSVTITTGSKGDRTYTATWTPTEFPITYDLADGTADNPASYTIESDDIVLNAPVRAGYDFLGWTGTDLDEATMEVVIESGSAGPRAYTATWEAVRYSIRYRLNGGTGRNPTSYTVESDDITLTSPTRQGFEFIGWTGSNSTEPQMTVTIVRGSTGNKTYEANWSAIEYAIAYDLAGGTATNPATYTIESDDITLTNPTRDGYTFAGWTGTDLTEPTMNVLIEAGSMGERAYAATWTADSYTISYDLDGGEVSEENPTTYTIESGSITLENPTKDGFEFTGWTGTDLDEATMVVTIESGSTGDRAYTATWTAVGFTISYDLAGGTVAQENPTYYTISGDPITLVNPTRDGYTFAGWTGTDLDEATQTVTIVTGSTGNRTYTATWTAVEYTITYDLDGGEAENPAAYTIESGDITLANPTKTGYVFAGWTGTDLDEAAQTVTIATGSTGDRAYAATWTAVEYTITYDLDGGEAENPAAYTIESDDITLVNPTKTGYTFAGWTGTDLDEAAQTVTIVTGSTGDRVYTATWTAVEYTITYDLAGGEAENPATYTIETETFALAEPTRVGYAFAGWIGSNGDEPQKTVLIAKGSTGAKNYTAVWTTVDYTITYDLKGGEVAGTNPASYTVESDPITLVNPTKRGYAFAGWTGTGLDEATAIVTIETGSTGKRDYTANWTATEYTITCDLAGGTVETANPVTYTVESDDITLANPAKEGYTFAGWTGSNGDEPQKTVTIAAGSVGDKAYTANWTAIEYAITYDLNGGEAQNPTTYTIESDDIILVNPTKAGYEFAGWTGTDLDEATAVVTIESGSMGDRAYTATWTRVDYTITYDLAGGALAEGAQNPAGYSVESEDITLANPTREGYTFAGWTGTELDEATDAVMIAKGSTGDRAYTATWTAIEYAITYDLDGGDAENPATYTIESADIILTAPTKEGYIFSGWTGTGVDEMTTAVTIPTGSTGDRTYTAHWSTDGYTITYDLAGGTGANPTYYTIETETFALTAPTKTGYVFAGWTGSNGDEPQAEVSIVKGSSGNKNYTANWTAIKYFVEYHSNTDDDASFTVEYEYDQTYAVPENTFTKIGATFEGWSATVGGEAITEIFNLTTENGDRIPMYAIWEDIPYTLTFDLNGATSGSVDGMDVTYGKKVELPDGSELTLFSDETEESRTFIGWLYDGTVYESGAEFVCPANNVVFTAVWSANYYALDQLVTTIEGYRDADAVPAGDNDAQYKAGGAIAEQIGSDGTYPWDNYDMSDVEAALENAGKAENRGLAQDQQATVDALTTALQNALDAITLLDADNDAATVCAYADAEYPSCEAEGKHSYNSILALADDIYAQDDADCLYTADSVNALRTALNGIKAEADGAALKAPAQTLLDGYVARMAEAFHTTLVLKNADYTALDKLITEYLPGKDGVEYADLATAYTADSIAALTEYYDNIDRDLTIVDQAKIEAGGEVYDALKAKIDALVPLTADYTDLFALILTIPAGSDGFSYPAADVTAENYAAWAAWANENAGAIASQMDGAYLTAHYTEASVNALYRVLNGLSWQKTVFQQDDVNGDGFMSYTTLLQSAIDGLKDRKYTVTFMANDGTDTVVATQSGYLYGDEIGTFPSEDPTRDEYVFKGWSSSADEAVPVSTDMTVTEDTTLYAIWRLASEEIVELVAREGSTTVIDTERGFIYGLKTNAKVEELLSDYLEVIGNGHLEFSSAMVGTGMVVTLVNDNTHEIAETYEIVIFGDVNGDGNVNSSDVTDIRNANAGLVPFTPGTAQYFAADVTHDGNVNSSDVTDVRSANAGLLPISQVIE